MTQEVVTRLRDDFDRSLGDDVETRQFCWGKSDLEFELNDENYQLFQQDYATACDIMDRWVKIARPAKRKRPVDAKENIKTFASRHGLDWRNPDVREKVRQWAVAHGHSATGKRVSREALEAYVKC